MALTGFRKSCLRLRGGIDYIALIDAAELISARYDHATDAYSDLLVEHGTGFVKYAFAEDQAQYSELVAGNVGKPVVRHELRFTIAGMNDATRRAVEQLANAKDGLAALVHGRQGEILLVGWSEKFGARRPLRLDRAAGISQQEPDQTPAEAIILTASDTEKAKNFTGEIPWKM